MSKQQWSSLITDTQKLQLFGMNVKVNTNFGDSFQGFVYYCDENFIILKNEEDYCMINQHQISELTPLNVQDPQQTLQNLLSIDLASLAQEMIKKEMKEPHQQLFDHLQKLYRDVEWKDKEILIPSIQIRIQPPYLSDNISGDNKKAVERLKKIVNLFSDDRLINTQKIFDFSILIIEHKNQEDEKPVQQNDNINHEEERRKEYIKDLQRRVKEQRKKPDCCQCCLAYWLFVLLGVIFRQFYNAITENNDGCTLIEYTIIILLSVFSISTCCRCIDGLCIILPSNSSKCFNLSLSFHEWNNIINFYTCKWALIILTVIWILNYSCTVFWPLFIFLLLTWLVVLLWKFMESE